MASSLKSMAWSRSFGRGRSAPPPDLMLPPRRRIHGQARRAIPGAVPAYAWLAAGLVVVTGALALLLRLALAASHLAGL